MTKRHIPGVLIIRREPCRMRRLGDLSSNNLVEGVDALAGRVEGVHEMHDGDCFAVVLRAG